MFAYFKLKINTFLLYPSFLRKPHCLQRENTVSRALVVKVNEKVIGCVWHCTPWCASLELWQLAERKVFSQTWIWGWWNLLNIFSTLPGHIRWFSPAAAFAPPSPFLQEAPCWDLPFSSVSEHPGGQWRVPGLRVGRPEYLLRLWDKPILRP